jgi:SAM-dependent methyltransferase
VVAIVSAPTDHRIYRPGWGPGDTRAARWLGGDRRDGYAFAPAWRGRQRDQSFLDPRLVWFTGCRSHLRAVSARGYGSLGLVAGQKTVLTARIAAILDGLPLEADGIYSSGPTILVEQTDEVREREAVATRPYPDLLAEVARHHSIRVMDAEVRRFLDRLPVDAVIVDVGGGWGWHWRRLGVELPHVCVVLVDLVRANLRRAADLLGRLVNDQVFLVHGDATSLPLPAAVFDGYWSVQALQHIPSFARTVEEAVRVLRRGGHFACYALNRSPLMAAAYRLTGRTYHVRGKRPGGFYLARGSTEEARIVRRVFGSPVTTRYSELLFHPDLKLHTGRSTSWTGSLDAHLSTRIRLFAPFARQRSYHARKSA